MLKLNSFVNEYCRLQHGLEGSKKQKTTPRYIGHRGVLTPRYLGLLDFHRVRLCDSPVHRTPGSQEELFGGKKPSTKNLMRLFL